MMNNISQNIINSSNRITSVNPKIYWAYRSNVQFTFFENTITKIDCIIFGSIEVKKLGVKVGHDVVILEKNDNRFRHKIKYVINDAGKVIDEMDDIVFFVKENLTWKIYGAKYGCWKDSQGSMLNANRNTLSVTFASRKGLEEEYESYNTTIDIDLLVNYYTITGGTIATGGRIQYVINNNQTGYILFPNGNKLTTVNGTINTIYQGVGGNITFYEPKTNLGYLELLSSDVIGDITYNGYSSLVVNYNYLITSVNAPLANFLQVTAIKMNYISANSALTVFSICSSLPSIIAPSAIVVFARDSNLTAKTIGDILFSAFLANRENVVYIFTGGTSANSTAINDYLVLTYNTTFLIITNKLISLGGDIITN